MQPLPTNRTPALDNDISSESAMSEFDEEAANFSLGNTYHPSNNYTGFDGENWISWDAPIDQPTWIQPASSSHCLPYPHPYQQQTQHPIYPPQYNATYLPPTHNNVVHFHRPTTEHSYPSTQQGQHYVPAGSPQNISYPTHATPQPILQNSNIPSRQVYQGQHISPPTSHPNHYHVPQYPTEQSHFPPLPIRHHTPSTALTPPIPASDPSIFINTFLDPTDVIHSQPLRLNWSPSVSDDNFSAAEHVPAPTPQSSKRKFASSPSPVIKQEPKADKSLPQPKGISDFLVVFENSPGALASIKKRKKLDEPVRKAAKDVRKAGACHQCRFRKRTCGTGTPCSTCLKQGSNLCELRCQRESPFIGKFMSQYFEHSSSRRVINFDVGYSSDLQSGIFEIIDIDGIGRLSHPLKLRAQRQKLTSMSADDQEFVNLTHSPRRGQLQASEPDVNLAEIMLLEERKSIGEEVEQWALEYTSKFIHAAGPDFYSTTMAQILGTAYVKKGLPESPLVAAMLRAASISFVLRAGVKYTMPANSATLPSPHFRTIQARIDSILYARLKIAERDLFGRLQILIFRTAGCLGKDQLYPVALVMFQLMRMLSLGASHLSNIAERFNGSLTTPADHMHHCQRLLLSVHLALFRSSTPLLLDFRGPESSPSPASTDSSSGSPAPEPRSSSSSSSKQPQQQPQQTPERPAPNYNRALLQNDDELCRLAMKMRKVILDFRKKGGRKEMKGSIAWRPEVWELFRGVYDGL